MQPHDPYNNPGQGGYPSGPNPPQGGAHPSGGYPPQGYGQPGGYPPQGQPGMPPGPPPMGPGATQPSGKMPGTVITVRVLQFIGGIFGLLIGGAILFSAVIIAGDQQALQEMNEILEQDAAVPVGIGSNEVIGGLVGFGAIPFVYGLVSTLLASFMGRRSGALLWGTVVFQGLSALFLLVMLVIGGAAGVLVFGIPLLFTIGMIILMVVPVSRAFYSPASQSSAPGPQY